MNESCVFGHIAGFDESLTESIPNAFCFLHVYLAPAQRPLDTVDVGLHFDQFSGPDKRGIDEIGDERWVEFLSKLKLEQSVIDVGPLILIGVL